MNDSIITTKGKIYVSGKPYNKQVYRISGSDGEPITQFNAWEEIDRILLSFDENYLLIYHKTDKDPSHKLSIVDLNSLNILRTIKPGFGGRLNWTEDNNILLVWGCGSPCSCFRLYNLEFEIITEECETAFREFISEDIIVSLPMLVPQDGTFKIWSLKEGNLIKEVSFKSKYGEYYSWNVELNDGQLEVELSNPDSDSVTTEKLIINN